MHRSLSSLRVRAQTACRQVIGNESRAIDPELLVRVKLGTNGTVAHLGVQDGLPWACGKAANNGVLASCKFPISLRSGFLHACR